MLLAEAERVEDLLAYHRNQVQCPIYTSIDVRRNAHKAAVVDANAFPAGFNNLARRSQDVAASAIASYVGRTYPGASDVLVIAEGHTRNAWYFQNLKALQDMFGAGGLGVTLGTLNPELFPATDVQTAHGDTITLHGVLREGDDLVADGTVHDVVVLNNDLSDGPPDILDGISQPVTPPPRMGWHRRRKSRHFRIVDELARQLGAHAGFDAWCISALFERVENVDFREQVGLDDVASAIDRVRDAVAAKYDEYGVDREPTVFIKADAGTYGMGVMTAASGEEFLGMNRKARDRMDRGKGRVKTTSVIVQEGVPTDLRIDQTTAEPATAEPVVYMVCGRVVGGFHRVHARKSDAESLNAPGATFSPFVLGDGEPGPDETMLDDVAAHVYRTIGEIASIATGYELALGVGEHIPSYP